MFYKDHNQNIILDCFNNIFKNSRMAHDFHNHTFYAHYMAKFYGLVNTNLLDNGYTFELIKRET